MPPVTAMQVARSASCFSTWNAVRRATLFTAPGALRDDVSSLTLPSDRATLCGGTGARALAHVGLSTRIAMTERGGCWQADLALWRRFECVHSSLANDTATTADGVGKSLTAAAVVREHEGSGAGSLAEIDFRPSPLSTASGGGREVASDQREPRARSPIAPPNPRRSAPYDAMVQELTDRPRHRR